MHKPKLLYVSPFSPMKSGISDYSEVLVYGLKKFYDIILCIDDYKIQNKNLYKDFEIRCHGIDNIDFAEFPYRIYNIGNNPAFHSFIYQMALTAPGLIVLHDIVLYYLVVEYYRKRNALYAQVYNMAGASGINKIKKYAKQGKDLLECKNIAAGLPLNQELINSGNKIMVHSHYAFKQVSNIINDLSLLRRINHVRLVSRDKGIIDKRILFKRFRLPQEAILISSFGSIENTKLNHVVCETINRLSAQADRVFYLMVGEGSYADRYLNKNIRKTGYLGISEFNSLIRHSDIIVNLRYPSMGETSGTLIRALGMGKPCIVSDDGWFSEIPDDAVIKIANRDVNQELFHKLLCLLNDEGLRTTISKNARDYIENEHGIEMIAQHIDAFLRSESNFFQS